MCKQCDKYKVMFELCGLVVCASNVISVTLYLVVMWLDLVCKQYDNIDNNIII